MSARAETGPSRVDQIKKWGAAGALSVAIATGGFLYGEAQTKDSLIEPGDLTHQLSAQLETQGYNAVRIPQGVTIENLKAAGVEFASLPLALADSDIEQKPVTQNWIAVDSKEAFFPVAEGTNAGKRSSLIRTENSKLQKALGKEVQVDTLTPADYAVLDTLYIASTGKPLLTNGFAMTSAKVDGLGVGIGRVGETGQLSYVTYDPATSSSAEAIPDSIKAMNVVVSK